MKHCPKQTRKKRDRRVRSSAHCNNPALLVSHFQASFWALNRRRGNAHKPDRKTGRLVNTAQQGSEILLSCPSFSNPGPKLSITVQKYLSCPCWNITKKTNVWPSNVKVWFFCLETCPHFFSSCDTCSPLRSSLRGQFNEVVTSQFRHHCFCSSTVSSRIFLWLGRLVQYDPIIFVIV